MRHFAKHLKYFHWVIMISFIVFILVSYNILFLFDNDGNQVKEIITGSGFHWQQEAAPVIIPTSVFLEICS